MAWLAVGFCTRRSSTVWTRGRFEQYSPYLRNFSFHLTKQSAIVRALDDVVKVLCRSEHAFARSLWNPAWTVCKSWCTVKEVCKVGCVIITSENNSDLCLSKMTKVCGKLFIWILRSVSSHNTSNMLDTSVTNVKSHHC